LYSAYPALPGGSMCWEQSVTRVTRQTGKQADRQTQWAHMYYHLSQPTANQNGKLIHCHHWDSNLWSSGCKRTSLTTQPSPTPCTVHLPITYPPICCEFEVFVLLLQVSVSRQWEETRWTFCTTTSSTPSFSLVTARWSSCYISTSRSVV
jgi:hypothetical protein